MLATNDNKCIISVTDHYQYAKLYVPTYNLAYFNNNLWLQLSIYCNLVFFTWCVIYCCKSHLKAFYYLYMYMQCILCIIIYRGSNAVWAHEALVALTMYDIYDIYDNYALYTASTTRSSIIQY